MEEDEKNLNFLWMGRSKKIQICSHTHLGLDMKKCKNQGDNVHERWQKFHIIVQIKCLRDEKKIIINSIFP